MLLDFTISNYRSIYAAASINMVATREQHLRNRCLFIERRHKKTVNPVAAIFGANAAGKSNFIKAMKTLQGFISDPPRPAEAMPYDPFALLKEAKNEPTVFELLFEWDEMVYEYVLTYDSQSVVGERLTRVLSRSDQDVVIRERDHIVFPTLPRRDDEVDEVTTLLGAVPSKVPLVSYVVELNYGDKVPRSISEPLLAVSSFLTSVLVVPAGTIETAVNRFGIGRWQNAMTQIDAGISGVHAEEVEVSAMGLGEGTLRDYRQELERFPDPIEVENENGRFTVSLSDGELVVKRIMLEHSNGTAAPVKLKWADESDGTKAAARLLELFSILSRPSMRGVLMVDEIDRSFHTELSRALIRGFLNTSGPDTRAQLLFTTHDLLLMDPGILRRDEIWLVEKDYKGQTGATVLSDYASTRKNADLRKDYLQGRFGGVPSLEPLGFLDG